MCDPRDGRKDTWGLPTAPPCGDTEHCTPDCPSARGHVMETKTPTGRNPGFASIPGNF